MCGSGAKTNVGGSTPAHVGLPSTFHSRPLSLPGRSLEGGHCPWRRRKCVTGRPALSSSPCHPARRDPSSTLRLRSSSITSRPPSPSTPLDQGPSRPGSAPSARPSSTTRRTPGATSCTGVPANADHFAHRCLSSPGVRACRRARIPRDASSVGRIDRARVRSRGRRWRRRPGNLESVARSVRRDQRRRHVAQRTRAIPRSQHPRADPWRGQMAGLHGFPLRARSGSVAGPTLPPRTSAPSTAAPRGRWASSDTRWPRSPRPRTPRSRRRRR